MKFKKIAVSLIFAVGLIGLNVCALGAAVIKDPKPNYVENNYKKLVKVNEVPEDFSDEHFLARPVVFTVDDEGNIYVYDMKIFKIFKFNKDCKFERVFSGQGQGPCEIAGTYSGGGRSLYYSDDGNLYYCDSIRRKIMAFSKEGRCLREFALPGREKSFPPVIDKKGNLYALAPMDSSDLLELYDKDLVKRAGFLSSKEVAQFLFYEPESPSVYRGAWGIPTANNTFYDTLGSGRLLVYMRYSSKAFIFENNRLKSSFYIWPKKALTVYKESVQADKNRQSPIYFTKSTFIDRDDNNSFYINFIGLNHPLYCFGSDGRLKKVLVTGDSHKREWIRFFAKRNGIFYASSLQGKIYLFKEEQ